MLIGWSMQLPDNVKFGTNINAIKNHQHILSKCAQGSKKHHNHCSVSQVVASICRQLSVRFALGFHGLADRYLYRHINAVGRANKELGLSHILYPTSLLASSRIILRFSLCEIVSKHLSVSRLKPMMDC